MKTTTNFDELEKELQQDHERQCETNRQLARKVDSEARVINALRANLNIATDLDRDDPSLAAQMNTRQTNTHKLHMKIAIAKHNHKPTAELVEQLNNDAIPDEQLAYLCECHIAIYKEIAAAFQEGGYCGWLMSLAPKSRSHRLVVELARADDETIGRLVHAYVKNRTGTDRLARANFEGLMWLDWAFQSHLKGEPLPQEDVWGANHGGVVTLDPVVNAPQTLMDNNEEGDAAKSQPIIETPQIPIRIQRGRSVEGNTISCLLACGKWSESYKVSDREANVLEALLKQFDEDAAKSLTLDQLNERSSQSDSSRALTDLEGRIPIITALIVRPGKRGVRGGYRLQLPVLKQSA